VPRFGDPDRLEKAMWNPVGALDPRDLSGASLPRFCGGFLGDVGRRRRRFSEAQGPRYRDAK
jgi:hypothetical protein